MRKKVWIFNHYATQAAVDLRGRHYWIARELVKLGYEPVIFCCNFEHFSAKFVNEDNPLWFEDTLPCGAKCVYIRSNAYHNNGKQRVLNMFRFAFNLKKVAKIYAKKYVRPDVIYGSSAHPLTVIVGEKLAKKWGVPSLCEVRDLWPESIFAYYPEKRKKWYAGMLVRGERKMYERANAIIMTWEGGKDYIVEQGWTDTIPLSKVYHIGNGVDLQEFHSFLSEHHFEDPDLSDKSHFNAVYTGSVRLVNNLGMLVDAAVELRNRGNSRVRMLIWGGGNELEPLRERVRELGLDNIVFKGFTARHNIPSILSQSDCTLLHNSSTVLDKYGQSQNKFFEYLAAGKPILMTYSVGYSICKKDGCGVELDEQTPEKIADALEAFSVMPKEQYDEMSKKALQVAENYDFKLHTRKLAEIIESL